MKRRKLLNKDRKGLPLSFQDGIASSQLEFVNVVGHLGQRLTAEKRYCPVRIEAAQNKTDNAS